MPDDLDDLAVRLRALGAHLDVGEPADPWPAIRARLTEPMSASRTEPEPGSDRLADPGQDRREGPGLLPDRLAEPGSDRHEGPGSVPDRLAEPGRDRREGPGLLPDRLAEPGSDRRKGPEPGSVRPASRWWRPRGAGATRSGRGVPVGRRWVLAGIAALIAVVAGVAPARAAVVDAVGGLLRIAGIEVRREPAPGGLPSRPSPLPSVSTVALADARRVALFPLRVPATLGAPEQVQLGDPDPAGAPRVVTLVYRGGTVRLDEFDGAVSPYFFKSAPEAEWTDVGGKQAIWLPAPHPVTYVGRDGVERTETARLAGPTLVWTGDEVTYRLEGLPDLEQARTIALSLR